ncbi:MAG: class I tRNA ligase family protein, partial [Breznakibacter sp.]|nr:class I tRNA ligase family protein [Breznakibacter sp.]
VSAFMICVNELTDLKCNKREILKPLSILLAPFAPHTAEELWSKLGGTESVCKAQWVAFDEKHLVESSFTYPVSFNGKTRFTLTLPLDLSVPEIQKIVLEHEQAVKWIEGKPIKKAIIIPNKIINIVV